MVAHNIPMNASPFVGRTRELADVLRLLADPACRLLTLVGPGGMGKTRLALEAARQMLDSDQQAEAANRPTEFPDGAFVVALQPIAAPEFIATAIADAVHYQFYEGDEPLEQLLCFLREKALLLVLDNFEHVLDGAGLVETLLTGAPGLKVLATSRERLNLQEEWLYTVEGMRFPRSDDDQPLEDFSAVRLFAQAARRLRPDFTLEAERGGVRRICELVEGMPLALELAASWVRTLSCTEIADEIARGLDILETSTRNMPQRHRSMRAVLDYSWTCLPDTERAAFQRLSVFHGGFTRAAAQAVAGASLRILSALVNKSLLRHNAIGRYDLHELVRQYAREQLESVPGTQAETIARHTAFYADFMAQRWIDLRGSQQRTAIAEIEGEIENVRAAWSYAIEQHDYAAVSRMVMALWYVHVLTYRSKDVHEIFSKAISALRAAPITPASQRALGLLLTTQGSILAEKGGNIQQGSVMGEGRAWLYEGLELLRAHASTPEDLVLALCSLCYASVMLLGWNANATLDRQEWVNITRLAQEGLQIARQANYTWGMAQMNYVSGLVAMVVDDFDTAQRLGDEALQLAQAAGDPALAGVIAGPFLGRVAELNGDYAESKRFRQLSNRALQEHGYWLQVGWNYQGMGYIAFLEHDYAEAERDYREALKVYLNVHDHPYRTGQINQSLVNVAKLWAAQGQLERALALVLAIRDSKESGEIAHEWTDELAAELKSRMTPDAAARAEQAAQALDTQTVAAAFVQEADAPLPLTSAAARPEALTEREHEILRLIADGLSNRDIAEKLVFSVGTVKWYINQIYSKLSVGSRTQALVRARELHLL
ncbi:MAG: hypothetical protein JNJ61_21105 [Anaerolineae bacterium]|nr:hypothetical protein [Anaerolineae bacterium]